MAPLSTRVANRAESGTRRAQRSGNRALIWLLAVSLWIRIVFSTVDFDGIGKLPPAAAANVANVANVLAPNTLTRVLKITLIVIGGLVILSHMKQARALIRRVNVFFLGFLILALISVVWSFDPGATLNRYVSFIATVLISCAFCLAGWHRRRFQTVTRPILTLLMAASLAYIVIAPE